MYGETEYTYIIEENLIKEKLLTACSHSTISNVHLNALQAGLYEEYPLVQHI